MTCRLIRIVVDDFVVDYNFFMEVFMNDQEKIKKMEKDISKLYAILTFVVMLLIVSLGWNFFNSRAALNDANYIADIYDQIDSPYNLTSTGYGSSIEDAEKNQNYWQIFWSDCGKRLHEEND